MNEKHEKYLCEKYPKIFKQYGAPPTESCMSWGLECSDGWFAIIDALCGRIQRHINNPPWVKQNLIIWHSKNIWNKVVWNHIIHPIIHPLVKKNNNFKGCRWRLYTKLSDILMASPKWVKPKKTPPQVVAEQIKEKYGTLRFYYSGGDKVVDALVDMAESMSERTCEYCGATDDTVEPTKGGWIKTLCSKCTTQREHR